MQEITFKNPPLIELIAEFRWIPANVNGQEVSPDTFLVSSDATELFYDDFKKAMARDGFTSSERLVPLGFPYPAYQPVFRFRHSDEKEITSVVQLGIGILSVHALPPYRGWKLFKPFVETSLAALVRARAGAVDKYFSSVTLRYINSFSDHFTQGKSARTFIKEALGIDLRLPASIEQEIGISEEVSTSVQVSAPIRDGLKLLMSLSPNLSTPNAVVMDLSVSRSGGLEWDVNQSLSTLEAAHSVLNKTFLEMTSPLHNLMEAH